MAKGPLSKLKVLDGDNAAALAIVAVTGPLTCVHPVRLIVAPLFPVAVPASVAVLTGSWIVCALPAFTVGGTLPEELWTTTVIVAPLVSQPLSVTVSR